MPPLLERLQSSSWVQNLQALRPLAALSRTLRSLRVHPNPLTLALAAADYRAATTTFLPFLRLLDGEATPGAVGKSGKQTALLPLQRAGVPWLRPPGSERTALRALTAAAPSTSTGNAGGGGEPLALGQDEGSPSSVAPCSARGVLLHTAAMQRERSCALAQPRLPAGDAVAPALAPVKFKTHLVPPSRQAQPRPSAAPTSGVPVIDASVDRGPPALTVEADDAAAAAQLGALLAALDELLRSLRAACIAPSADEDNFSRDMAKPDGLPFAVRLKAARAASRCALSEADALVGCLLPTPRGAEASAADYAGQLAVSSALAMAAGVVAPTGGAQQHERDEPHLGWHAASSLPNCEEDRFQPSLPGISALIPVASDAVRLVHAALRESVGAMVGGLGSAAGFQSVDAWARALALQQQRLLRNVNAAIVASALAV